tara:strand:+ start:485 stop:958 length:474 start_codon:yes stop_codon:yes gene_type:complete
MSPIAICAVLEFHFLGYPNLDGQWATNEEAIRQCIHAGLIRVKEAGVNTKTLYELTPLGKVFVAQLQGLVPGETHEAFLQKCADEIQVVMVDIEGYHQTAEQGIDELELEKENLEREAARQKRIIEGQKRVIQGQRRQLVGVRRAMGIKPPRRRLAL